MEEKLDTRVRSGYLCNLDSGKGVIVAIGVAVDEGKRLALSNAVAGILGDGTKCRVVDGVESATIVLR